MPWFNWTSSSKANVIQNELNLFRNYILCWFVDQMFSNDIGNYSFDTTLCTKMTITFSSYFIWNKNKNKNKNCYWFEFSQRNCFECDVPIYCWNCFYFLHKRHWWNIGMQNKTKIEKCFNIIQFLNKYSTMCLLLTNAPIQIIENLNKHVVKNTRRKIEKSSEEKNGQIIK